MTAAGGKSASLVLLNARLGPPYQFNLVQRILDDYSVANLQIYVASGEKCFYAWLLEKFQEVPGVHEIGDQAQILGEIVFFLYPRANTEGAWPFVDYTTPSQNRQLEIQPGAMVIDVDPYGRSVPRSEDDQSLGLGEFSSAFQRYSTLDDRWAGNFSYFPYFPVWRNPAEVGAQRISRHVESPFGFRSRRDRMGAKESRGDYVVLLYGGSAAYGLYNSEARSISGWLEAIIEERLRVLKPGFTVTVVNLAQPSGTVTEASAIHTLVGQSLEPDHVILHCGWNDVPAARRADPVMLAHGIPHSSAVWPFVEVLHGAGKGEFLPAGTLHATHFNPIDLALKSVLERMRLFYKLVTCQGARLTIGIQPTVLHRTRPHPDEETFVRKLVLESPERVQRLDRNIASLRDLASDLSRSPFGDAVLDFEPTFRDLPETELCFWDRVHPTSTGCKLAAEAYADRILAEIHERSDIADE